MNKITVCMTAAASISIFSVVSHSLYRVRRTMACEKWFFYNLLWHFRRSQNTSYEWIFFFDSRRQCEKLKMTRATLLWWVERRDENMKKKVFCDFNSSECIAIFLNITWLWSFFSTQFVLWINMYDNSQRWWLRVRWRRLLVLKCPSEKL